MILRFHPLAIKEFEKSIRWYQARSSNAPWNFREEVDGVLTRILRGPKMFPAISEDFRGAVLQRFPYWVIFQVYEDSILIVAICHAKRRTGYWKKRSMPNPPASDVV
jgi:toxin ParE2